MADPDVANPVGALLLLGASPLILGSLFDSRFDLWPTLLAVGALAALIRERPFVTGALLALGFAAKLWPGALLPIAVAAWACLIFIISSNLNTRAAPTSDIGCIRSRSWDSRR